MRRAASITVIFALHLVGCGGGGPSAISPPPGSGTPVTPLYVAARDRIDVFPTTATGTTLPAGRSPGSTKQRGRCRGIIESATANGSSGVQGSFPCTGSQPLGVARGANGEIVTLAVTSGYGDNDVVERSLNGTVTGSFNIGDITTHRAIVVAGDGGIYTAARTYAAYTSDVVEWQPTGHGQKEARPHFQVPARAESLALAPDGTVYVGSNNTVSSFTSPPPSYVYVFEPGQPDFTPPARSIGPFPDTSIIGGLACDDQNQLYVGLNTRDNSGTQVSVYAPQAAGPATPLRVLLDPVPPDDPAGAAIVGLAIGSTAAPNQSLARRR